MIRKLSFAGNPKNALYANKVGVNQKTILTVLNEKGTIRSHDTRDRAITLEDVHSSIVGVAIRGLSQGRLIVQADTTITSRIVSHHGLTRVWRLADQSTQASGGSK